MKIIFKTAALATLILTTSCGKDTANAIADLFDDEVEQLENTVLDVETISDNVLIEGGTKMEGTPPTPNGAISLDISDSGKTAFLGEGFNVSLASDADIVGAYIQFKSKEGSISDAYYDIDLETNNIDADDKSSRRRRVAKINSSSLTSKTDETVLDVDFNTTIEPGEFCYVLCVYDASGNISDPEEVCLTVESWGGNSDLIGLWKLTKSEYTEDGETTTTDAGEEDCNYYNNLECSGGGTYQLGQCETRDVQEITINSDGSYDFELRISGRYVNPSQSDANCEQEYSETGFFYISSGKWAYISGEDKLALLEYTYTEGYEDEQESEEFSGTNEVGQAYSLYDGKIQLNGNTFIMRETTYEDDGVVDRVDNYFYEKE